MINLPFDSLYYVRYACRCNFGGLIICSSDVPYTTEGLTMDRCYRRMSEEEIKAGRSGNMAYDNEAFAVYIG